MDFNLGFWREKGEKNMLNKIKAFLALKKHKREWRRRNPNNFTSAETMFIIDNVSVGDYTYGSLNIEHYYKPAKLKIGKYCSIAKNVTFLLGGNHGSKAITTYPYGPRIYGQNVVGGTDKPLKWKVDIIVEDDVWIGYDALILQGVTIGRGSIIGARSVVTKDIPPYSVYAGTKIMKKRFSDEIIEKLMQIDYDKIKHHKSDSFESVWNEEITEENVDHIINAFKN